MARPASTPYTPDSAAAAIAVLASCAPRTQCQPYDDLHAYGALAATELLTAIENRAQPREVLLDLLLRAKAPGSGVRLVALADAMPLHRDSGRMYSIAASIEADAVFDQLIETTTRALDRDPDRVWAVGWGLGGALRARTLAWIGETLATNKHAVALAEIVQRISTRADVDAVVNMLRVTYDRRARHRVAQRAIVLGATDGAVFETLLLGLTSKDRALRDDARRQVTAEVITPPHVPAFRRALEAMLDETSGDDQRDTARKTLVLGSTDPRAFEALFGGLGGTDERTRVAALQQARSLARHLAQPLVTTLAAQLDALPAATSKRDRRLRELAREALARRTH